MMRLGNRMEHRIGFEGGISASLRKLFVHMLMITACMMMIYPLIWMVFSSFKPVHEIFAASLLPKEWSLQNYSSGWLAIPNVQFGQFFINSTIVSGLVVIGNVLSASLVGFAFSRLRFALQSFWFVVMMMTMMLPYQVVLIPQYVIFHQLNWIDTYLPITIPHFLGGTPFFIFLFIQFFRGIPRDMDEAAIIDGCNTFAIYYRILMPLCVPAIVTTVIFSFIWTWDDFFSQLLYINSIAKYTVPLGLRLFIDSSSENQWGQMLAMSVLSLLPTFGLFLACQKYFVQGISTTGLKG
ncbi:carbohydrate ABC transporter permease [Paenibacillus sp. J5C_2022]|uniref:carbohydrate ABC transporter permease n=1 Tax=Paenibacillus sp. J5C2022 TaxID=2977129 RepID=UPI0021D3387D|nr:carbohydrate ABC transporter permease [Paenibacillus sp. J5C2022]MCU6707362.1 carbohydrate ABC transporter permease [Paenibacillus sp. J5C2022]